MPRAPKHIRDLAELGVSLQQLTLFRYQLSGFRITLSWNERRRSWMFFKVTHTGPTTIQLYVGPGRLVELIADYLQVGREFERMERECAAVAN